MEFLYREKDMLLKVIYWGNFTLADIESGLADVDALEILYPRSVSEDIYDKYESCIEFVDFHGNRRGETHSAEIDITKTEQSILGGVSKTCKYEIKRADTRDPLHFTMNYMPSEHDLERYFDFYDDFSKTKGRSPINRERILALADSKSYAVAEMYGEDGSLLASHGYLIDNSEMIASLCTSSSLFRISKEKASLISRANRLLHYRSMLDFKEKGFRIYDFGGLYIGDENEELSNISKFKMSFGGEVKSYRFSFRIHKKKVKMVEEYISEIEPYIAGKDIVIWGATWKGRTAERCIEKAYGRKPVFFIDNRLSCSDPEYVSDEKLADADENNTAIIIATYPKSYRKIIEQDKIKRFIDCGSVFFIDV